MTLVEEDTIDSLYETARSTIVYNAQNTLSMKGYASRVDRDLHITPRMQYSETYE